LASLEKAVPGPRSQRTRQSPSTLRPPEQCFLSTPSPPPMTPAPLELPPPSPLPPARPPRSSLFFPLWSALPLDVAGHIVISNHLISNPSEWFQVPLPSPLCDRSHRLASTGAVTPSLPRLPLYSADWHSRTLEPPSGPLPSDFTRTPPPSPARLSYRGGLLPPPSKLTMPSHIIPMCRVGSRLPCGGIYAFDACAPSPQQPHGAIPFPGGRVGRHPIKSDRFSLFFQSPLTLQIPPPSTPLSRGWPLDTIPSISVSSPMCHCPVTIGGYIPRTP